MHQQQPEDGPLTRAEFGSGAGFIYGTSRFWSGNEGSFWRHFPRRSELGVVIVRAWISGRLAVSEANLSKG
jgi:hypothetical protein